MFGVGNLLAEILKSSIENIRTQPHQNFPKIHQWSPEPSIVLSFVSRTFHPLIITSARYFSLPISLLIAHTSSRTSSSSSPMATAEQLNSQPAASFYTILGVSRDASVAKVRAAYRTLAMKWHPDRCRREHVSEANRRFQQIKEAYEVLSDERKRALYDAGLYDSLSCEQDGGVEDVEGFWDFIQEISRLIEEEKYKQEECTIEELQRMLVDMAEGFVFPPAPTLYPPANACTAAGVVQMSEPSEGSSRRSKRYSSEANWMASRRTRVKCRNF